MISLVLVFSAFGFPKRRVVEEYFIRQLSRSVFVVMTLSRKTMDLNNLNIVFFLSVFGVMKSLYLVAMFDISAES